MLDQVMIENVAIVALITGAVQALKQSINHPIVEQTAPLIALVLGVLIQIGLEGATVQNVLIGVTYGLISMGLYSGTKKTAKTVRQLTK